jgi:hypothetical protein
MEAGVKRKARADEDANAIRCICGFDCDDGFSIACDSCSRWSHAACFGIVNDAVPEVWKCWLCQPKGQRPRRRRRQPSMQTAQVDDSDEPATHSYVPIATDNVHPDARATLRRYSKDWRGLSALTTHSQLTLRQIPPASLCIPYSNPDVLPPTYSLHTTTAISAHDFIAPFTSSIIPSSSYLADPLNAYTHLGMPKPFVHLIGPPFDLALDARLSGDRSRFARSGCRPNAILRPMLCDDLVAFGLFALRDLSPNEEIVLGWEWDDGNAVHSLPALIQTPELFP